MQNIDDSEVIITQESESDRTTPENKDVLDLA